MHFSLFLQNGKTHLLKYNPNKRLYLYPFFISTIKITIMKTHLSLRHAIVAISACTSMFFSSCDSSGPVVLPVETISADITADRTLTNFRDGVDYRVTDCIMVNNGAILTVEPGTTIEFASGACLRMEDMGALHAVGTAAAVITFTGQQHTAGFWQGLFFINSNNTENELTYCSVTDAGGSNNNYEDAAITVGKAPIYTDGGARLVLNNTEISNSEGYGLYVSKYSTITQINNCVITGNALAPVHLLAANWDVVDDDNTFTGNSDDYIYVDATMVQSGIVEANVSISALSVPYYVDGSVDVQAQLTIGSGTELIFSSNGEMTAYGNGFSITVNGTGAAPVVFEGEQHTAGFWKGLGVRGGASLSLTSAQVKDAGNQKMGTGVANVEGAVFADGFGATTLFVSNCSISNSARHGISYNNNGQVTVNANLGAVNTFSMISGNNVNPF